MTTTFIIDCPRCRAKVAAEGKGETSSSHYDDDVGEPFGYRISIGKCPSCTLILVGRAEQIEFEGWEGRVHDSYGDVVRVYPDPPKVFTSYRIPKSLTQSLLEAERCMQVSAYIAAAVMLGRALEALCRDVLAPSGAAPTTEGKSDKPNKPVMLGKGIRDLKENKIIDDRLYDWSLKRVGV